MDRPGVGGGTAVTLSGHTLVRGVFKESSSLLSQLKLFVSLVSHIPRTSQARATAGWSQGIVRSQVIHSISYDGHFPPPLVSTGRILCALSLSAPPCSSFPRPLIVTDALPLCPGFGSSTPAHSSPFLASSTFLAASPALNPPFETQMRCPSANSNLSSWLGHAQGQWCGKCTHASVSGQR